MAKAEVYVGELLLKLFAKETGEISKVDYFPQKPPFNPEKMAGEQFLERTSPESQGVSSAFFYDLLTDLSEDPECKMHKFMALRHGKVICECAFDPYPLDMWHVSYSMCKSITGLAIGILIDEGKLSLETKLNEIFGARFSPFGIFKRSITVLNLLNMSSGVDFNEAGALSGNDWRQSFFDASFKFDPGTKFEYNSMNSYMLSAIVTEITGMSMFDFCKERIFEPLGIKRVFWEACPQSITKGGWGLFMRAEDMAKLGQLFLRGGFWYGKRIVSPEWIQKATSWQIETGSDDNKHYGFQVWINDDRTGSYSFNGMLGQNVFVYPDLDMVVVTNAGNEDIFQTSTMAVRIRNAMKNDIVYAFGELPENEGEYNKLKALCSSLSGTDYNLPYICGGGWKTRTVPMTKGRPRREVKVIRSGRHDFKASVNSFNIRNENQLINRWLKCLDGRTYELENSGVGIFPLMTQIVHNNFTDGLKGIGFRLRDNNSFYIDLYEGEAIFSLRCGFGGKRYYTEINLHGERYVTCLVSQCTRDENNRMVLKNEVYFPEEACMRTFNIYFNDEPANKEDHSTTFIHPAVPATLEIRLLETPGTGMFFNTIRNMNLEGAGFENIIFNKFFKGGIKEAFREASKNTIQPVIHGKIVN